MEKRLFLTPCLGLLQQERALTSHFLPVKKISEANFILTHKLHGSSVLSLRSWTKEELEDSDAVHEMVSSLGGAPLSKRPPRWDPRAKETDANEFNPNALASGKTNGRDYFWIPLSRVGLWFERS